jgi:hypothetical protein
MSGKAIVVFTGKCIERILGEGGSSSWRLDRNNARQCDYVVCTQNGHADGPWADGTEEHRTAFVIGKVKDVVPSALMPGRYLIQFREFARVCIPNVWNGDRNPVKYTTMSDIGIDPMSLDWECMPEASSTPDPPLDVTPYVAGEPLTIAEAKQGLALTFGVSPEAVEITIRG